MTEATTTMDRAALLPGARAILSRVLVGIDSSAESREAARQAARLMDNEGELELLAAYQVIHPAVPGPGPALVIDRDVFKEAAADALERARADIHERLDTVGKIVEGRPAEALRAEIIREHSTLVVAGSHGNGRMAGILLGSTATDLVHRASCSVLIARMGAPAKLGRIVVGVDGSPESAAAYAVAQGLADRFDAELWTVVAWRGKSVDRKLVETITTRHEDSPDEPVRALVTASADADLLVIGSRGLHGFKALGSVSERVAHEARTTTLIVRKPDWQKVSEELA